MRREKYVIRFSFGEKLRMKIEDKSRRTKKKEEEG